MDQFYTAAKNKAQARPQRPQARSITEIDKQIEISGS